MLCCGPLLPLFTPKCSFCPLQQMPTCCTWGALLSQAPFRMAGQPGVGPGLKIKTACRRAECSTSVRCEKQDIASSPQPSSLLLNDGHQTTLDNLNRQLWPQLFPIF